MLLHLPLVTQTIPEMLVPQSELNSRRLFRHTCLAAGKSVRVVGVARAIAHRDRVWFLYRRL